MVFKFDKFSNFLIHCSWFISVSKLKRSPRAAKDNQWGHMRPADRQFDMPALNVYQSFATDEIQIFLYWIDVPCEFQSESCQCLDRDILPVCLAIPVWILLPMGRRLMGRKGIGVHCIAHKFLWNNNVVWICHIGAFLLHPIVEIGSILFHLVGWICAVYSFQICLLGQNPLAL